MCMPRQCGYYMYLTWSCFNLALYFCTHTHTHTRTHLRTRTRTRTCTHTHLRTRTRKHAHTHSHTHMYAHTHTHLRTRIRTHTRAQTHTHHTYSHTYHHNTCTSVCTYSYTRSSLYLHVDCWTFPILYHSTEQFTICVFPVFCCLFVLFHNVFKKKNVLHTIFKYGENKDIVLFLYCIGKWSRNYSFWNLSLILILNLKSFVNTGPDGVFCL